jgi:uncharacterized protein (TIGR03000 family)
MYGVLLMAALSVGSATPSWGGHGCWGGGGCGCYGGYGRHGGYGCYGGGYGCYGYGSYAVYGSGGYGCCGGYTGFYSPYYPAGTPAHAPGSAPTDTTPTPPKPTTDTTPTPPKPTPPPKSTSVPGPARLIVDLPADAKLYVDGQLTKTSSARRDFSTPELEPGKAYFYELRAEVTRDGKAIDRTQRVTVRAGEISKVSFADLDRLGSAPTVARLQR